MRRTPTIARLLTLCRPAAIRRFVVAVIVDAVQRVANRRLRPHVGKEGVKTASPAIAHADTTPAVVRIAARRGGVTAGQCSTPGAIFRRLPSMTPVPVAQVCASANMFCVITPARLAVPRGEMWRADAAFRPTRAATEPDGVGASARPAPRREFCNNRPSTEQPTDLNTLTHAVYFTPKACHAR